MNYGWSNYGEEKISKFFTSTISAFVFMYFTEKAPSPWEKKGKDFGCENYLKVERKKPFHSASERLTTIRPITVFKKTFEWTKNHLKNYFLG